MVISELTGGMGNQMFQYAAAKALSGHHHTDLMLDVISFYREELPYLEVPRNFDLYNFKGVNEILISDRNQIADNNFYKKNKLAKLFPPHRRKVYKEPFYHFDKNFFKSRKDVLLKGGWQSEKYFSAHKNEVRQAFRVKDEVIKPVKELGHQLNNENSVAVHVRRGDYLRLPIILEWHGVLDASHYNNALLLLRSKLEKPFSIYYFSDDPLWVEENLCQKWPGKIISKDSQNTAIEDFYLMSQCRHNLIANSSFSWWAAWLNPNPDKTVIAPQKWFNKAPLDTRDLIPENWIKI